MTIISIRAVDVLGVVVGSWLLFKAYRTSRIYPKSTQLQGPSSQNWLFGVIRLLENPDDAARLFDTWSKAYGPVFQMPSSFGRKVVILMDPKAVAHFYSKETSVYQKDEFTKKLIASVVGKGLLWAEGDIHKRQRKVLNPAFTSAAIRDHISIFYESAGKVKYAWDEVLTNSPDGEAIIDIQKWMNCVTLDTIGLAAFGHDFGALQGKNGDVEASFDELGSVPPLGLDMFLGILGPFLPFVRKIPTKRQLVLAKVHNSMQEIAVKLLQQSRKDSETGVISQSSRSIMGTLIRAESASAKSTLTEEEVLAQMETLMIAGYETTSITLTRALIKLALHPEKQDRLREEIMAFGDGDPSYDQLANELPYLNGVFMEILRIHAPVRVTFRTALQDDVVPLSEPIISTSGELIDNVAISANARIMIPIGAINRSEAIWGKDANEFKPERWLDDEAGLTEKAKDFQGYHHLLSFVDGPRICLGRLFAVAEFKAVLFELIRNYVFEMRDGPQTKMVEVITILQRPKVEGEEGYAVPMRVRRYGG